MAPLLHRAAITSIKPW